MRRLDPRVRKIWAIRYGIWTFIAFAVSAFREISAYLSGSESWLIPGATTGLVVLIGTGATIAIPHFRYRYWSYELAENELRLIRGVITRVFTIVPLRRVQHLDVSQNVFEREFELGKLVVYTAGTQGNRVVVPGLPIEEARSLRDRLKEYILEDAV